LLIEAFPLLLDDKTEKERLIPGERQGLYTGLFSVKQAGSLKVGESPENQPGVTLKVAKM